MLSRRIFGACALCSAVGLIASGVEAQPRIPAESSDLKITMLRRADMSGGAHEVVQLLVEAMPNAVAPRHTHPGVESAVILEGSGVQEIDGQAPLQVSPGDTWQVAGRSAARRALRAPGMQVRRPSVGRERQADNLAGVATL
jgi:quercetin dioxygenase-like cupin family protein